MVKLPDKTLFDSALVHAIGRCYIIDAKYCPSCVCNYYGKIQTSTSILSLPDKNSTGCFYMPNNLICPYKDYINTNYPVCTKDNIKNGANTIRIGL